MKSAEKYRCCLGRLLWLLLTLISVNVIAEPGEMTLGDKEQTLPLLETKTGAYTNVTVTKKTKDWVFILHSQGVCNVRASDLSTEARIALGYEEVPKSGEPKGAKSSSQPFAQLSHLKLQEVEKFALDWRHNRKEKQAEFHAFLAANPMIVCGILGVVAVLHIISSTLFWLICRKTHTAPGPLVWVPILQLIPLLRAANMSRLWFFGFLIFPLNIIAQIVFSIKITKSRGKSPWVAFLLILPPTSLFAFLYLAFSRSAPVQMANNEVLALETA